MSDTTPAATAAPHRNPLRRLYHWVLSWADHAWGGWILFALAFCESTFFPIPPDVLLIALCLGLRRKWWRFALGCTLGSVLGGMAGYLLGVWLLEPVCLPLIATLGLEGEFARASLLYRTYDVWAVAAAGFSPIPYKVFTVSAGIARLDFLPFVVASTASRAARFFLVAALLYRFGEPARVFIDRHLNRLALAFVVLIALGFWGLSTLGGHHAIEIDREAAAALIDRLDSPDLAVRREVALELQQSTGHYEAFRADGSAEVRATAIERWRAWLARQP